METGTQVDQRRKVLRNHPIDGQALKKLVQASLVWLRTNQQIVNTLNVFPVPDGDTGTNMVLTMQAACDEVADSLELNVGKMAHAIAHGALMGARGNSGVILSQLWRGFARALDNHPLLDVPLMVEAFGVARDTAYKGVVRPVEGTILTVAKDIATAAEIALLDVQDPISLLETVVRAAETSVEHTPELLPVLKEAGVVDAGGKGLFYLLEGILRYIDGQPLDISLATVQPLSELVLENNRELIEPGQDYEIVVDFRPDIPLELPVFYDRLQQMGTSIQLGEGDGFYRLHIHVPTANLYLPIEYTRSLGVVTKIGIENLIEQMSRSERYTETEPLKLATIEPGQIAAIAVSPGIGISRVFASLGIAALVDGGQTMNPSTQQILQAFEDLPTDRVVILPNNKNIILAAKAAADLTVKRVAVIPTCSVPQGLAAIMRLMPDGDFDSVVREMTAAIDTVQTGEITIATRSVEIDGVEVREGQIIALHNGKLVLCGENLEQVCLGFLEKANAEQYELITLFYGANIERQEAMRIADSIRNLYSELEVEIQEGCQPHYPFIISIE